MKEEKNLLTVKLLLEYYKKNITDKYRLVLDRIVLDNDVLNTMERLYITPLNKHQKLKQESQKLKTDYEKEKYLVDKYTRQLTDEYKNTKKAIQQRDLYKSIIDEVRQIINYYGITPEENDNSTLRHTLRDMSKILDKVKESK